MVTMSACSPYQQEYTSITKVRVESRILENEQLVGFARTRFYLLIDINVFG